MPALVQGTAQATLGISHLTTSRRHLARPVLRAGETTAGFQLDGFTPWVTGARHAQHVLTGATLADGRHILLLVPLDAPGVSVAEPVRLVALNASQTGPVHFDHAEVPRACLVAGPAEDVMQAATGASTGGLPTSALALGLARSALEYVEEEAERRKELIHPVEQLAAEWRAIRDQLLRLAAGEGPGTLVDLRARANSLVLRAAQMALVAAKGAGFVEGHPAGRWCREALFFLVWSCPQPVLDANLCELAGIAD
jgi:alkylation response protein AidB-like acyl-CoA dehydrogenase